MFILGQDGAEAGWNMDQRVGILAAGFDHGNAGPTVLGQITGHHASGCTTSYNQHVKAFSCHIYPLRIALERMSIEGG